MEPSSLFPSSSYESSPFDNQILPTATDPAIETIVRDCDRLKTEQVSLKTFLRISNTPTIIPYCLNVQQAKAHLVLFSFNGLSPQTEMTIFVATTKLYEKRFLELISKSKEMSFENFLNPSHLKQSCFSNVVFPTYFSQRILIRPPISKEEGEKLFEIFEEENCAPFSDVADFVRVVEHEGKYIQKTSKENLEEIQCVSVVGGGEEGSDLLAGAYFVFLINDDRLHCRIECLWVDPRSRGRGIGTLLISSILYEAIDRGCETVEVYVTKEETFLFAELGFLPRMKKKKDFPKE